MKKLIIITLLFYVVTLGVFAQMVNKVEPQCWWTGMQTNTIELLVYGNDIKGMHVAVSPGQTKIVRVENADSPNYLFVTIEIGERQKPGDIDLIFSKGDKKEIVKYPLLARENSDKLHKGFDGSDVIYLLMPDRFANGDVSNDAISEMKEKADRKNPNGRHGGDIAGIISKLDYLSELGVTAIWPTPLWESNHEKNSYHGYACTDFYNIDPRYGNNRMYKQLAKECHNRGLKMIMDMVPNHCSISHPWLSDLPVNDWVYLIPDNYVRSLAISAWTDPYVSGIDYKWNKDGWFSPLMPDLNQNNEKLLRYLTQNAIWWIEYAGLDGIRVDTYPYCEKDKIAVWTKAVTDEYPHINIVGEVWQPQPSSVAYWQKDAYNKDGYNSNLPCVMDFPLMDAIKEAFNSGNNNVRRSTNKLFGILAQDYLYTDRNNIMTFADNHDTERIATLIGGDKDLYKAVFAFLFTTRGIPQFYYGSEIMMNSEIEGVYTSNSNRKEMEGGWLGDNRNVFTQAGRSLVENEVFGYISKLLNWRKNKSVIHSGNLKHFKPNNGTYIYFRYDNFDCIMVILNITDEAETIDTARYEEMLQYYKTGVDVMTGENLNDLRTINIAPKSAKIIELKK